MRVRTLTLAFLTALGSTLASAGPALALAAQPTTELNVRVGPSTTTAIVRTLQAGQVIDIVSCGSGWCKLSSGGFVSEAYLAPAGPAVAPPLPAAPAGLAAAPQPAPAAYGSPPAGPRAFGDPYVGGGFADGYASSSPSAQGWTDDDANSWTEAAADPWGNGYDEPWDTGFGSGWGQGQREGWADGYGAYERPDDDFAFGAPPTGFRFHIASEPESFPFAFGIESTVRPPACFYDRPGYRGDAFCRFASVSAPHLRRRWDDRIGSIYVRPGYAVEVCTGAEFTGYCRVLTTSDNWVGRALDDDISSYRVFRR